MKFRKKPVVIEGMNAKRAKAMIDKGTPAGMEKTLEWWEAYGYLECIRGREISVLMDRLEQASTETKNASEAMAIVEAACRDFLESINPGKVSE